MKRHLLIALVALSVTPGMAAAQMMGGGGAPSPAPAQQDAKPQMSSPGMSAGMMGQGMMSGMMGQGKEMMCGGMMPSKTRGCMMMAEGMMQGQMDMAQMRKTLALSDEQSERLKAGQRPFQKETILTLATLKIAELELTDLLGGEKVDFGKVEAKLKEIEAMRTKVRLAHFKAAEAVKGVLNKEQLEKLQGAVESAPPPPAPANPAMPQKGATPGTGSEHEQHH